MVKVKDMMSAMMGAKRGRGWHRDPEGHAQAGRKGGKTTAKKYGEEFYSEIGRKGGKSKGNSGKSSKGMMMEE